MPSATPWVAPVLRRQPVHQLLQAVGLGVEEGGIGGDADLGHRQQGRDQRRDEFPVVALAAGPEPGPEVLVEGAGAEQVAGQVGAVRRVRDPFDRAGEVGHPEAQELPGDVLEAVVEERFGVLGGPQVHPGMALGSRPAVLVQEAEDLEGVAALARDGDPLAAQEGEVEGQVVPDDHQVRSGERVQGVAERGDREVGDAGVERAPEEQVGDAVDQQSGADDLVPAAQAGGLQVEDDGRGGPRECLPARAGRGRSWSWGTFLVVGPLGLGVGLGLDGLLHLGGEVALGPGGLPLEVRVRRAVRVARGQLALLAFVLGGEVVQAEARR